MMETVSDVYDLTYPSPVSLQEISSIVVAADLWRKGLKKNIKLENLIPYLPSAIYNSLKEYVRTLRDSIWSWRNYHSFCRVFDCSWLVILNRFNDFAWDWDGTIHEERTAKRMMMCDRFTQVEKFKIACVYCFEDDIKQIWPSVSEMMKLDEINFFYCPEQYYWICYLQNKLHWIPIVNRYPIAEEMLIRSSALECKWRNRSFLVYFWNRLPSDSQPPSQVYSNHYWREQFARFILPILNEHQLDIFVAKDGCHLIQSLMADESTLLHVLPTWMYIRSRIDLRNFLHFINGLLEEKYIHSHFNSKRVSNLFSEIWNSAPQHFKRSVLDDVLYNDLISRIRNTSLWDNRRMKLLIIVLQDATFEERNAFWRKNWRNLIFSAHPEDLVVMMKLSFRNENEITLFKKNVMSVYKNIAKDCALLLKCSLYEAFEPVNDVLSICCLNERQRKEYKRRLLRSNYIGKKSVLTVDVIRNNKSLNEFIDDAFQDTADLGVEFKKQLRSSPVTQHCLLECIRQGWLFLHLIEFVDSFFSDEQIVVSLKKRFFQYFKKQLIAGRISSIDGADMQVFLIWLLGSEDEVIGFKQSIPVEDIVRTMMQGEEIKITQFCGGHRKPQFPWKVHCFLMWYLNNDEEEVDKCAELFHDKVKSFVTTSTKRRRIV
ncbi:uncharacterized protein LOC135837698 [Planococcus citri]|uniref:uncharacterized protein LOC135837698 n=1 Tax=Planococcus citri TaxID=170843 RepID=UPI0031FA3AC2